MTPADDPSVSGTGAPAGRRKPWEKESQDEEHGEAGETPQGLEALTAQP